MTRNSKQKTLILNIINSSYNHPNAYQIYDECKKVIPNISLGTVYRNLNNLVDNNEIRVIKTKEDVVRYDKIYNKHAHFICTNCGNIIDLDKKYYKEISSIENNVVFDCEINYKGICEHCMKERN
jgi:ferric uptake regulator